MSREPEVVVFEEPTFKKRKIATREKDICRVSYGRSYTVAIARFSRW